MSKKWTTILMVFLSIAVASFSLLASFPLTETETIFIDSLKNEIDPEHSSEFSFALEQKGYSDDLLAKSEKINRRFYNPRNMVAFSSKPSWLRGDSNLLISPISRLDENNVFSTNHISFVTDSEGPIVDLTDFPTNGNYGPETEAFIPAVIPATMARAHIEIQDAPLRSLLGKTIFLTNQPLPLLICGIWENAPTYELYYANYNSFYRDLCEEMIFLNTESFQKYKTDVSTFLLFGNKFGSSNEFYHYCENILGNKKRLIVPDIKMNSTERIGVDLLSLHNEIVSSLNDEKRMVIRICFPILCSACIVMSGYLLWRKKKDLSSEKVRSFLFLTPLASCLSAVAFYSLFQSFGINGVPYFPFTKAGLISLSLSTLVLTIGIFVLTYKKPKTVLNLTRENGGDVVFVSFSDLSVRNATTIRISNFMKILESDGIHCDHIGFYDVRLSKERDYGTRHSKNKLMSYLFSPFHYVSALKKARLQHNFSCAFIYSPLPIFTSIFIVLYLRAAGIPIIHDVNEYQSLCEVNFKKPGWFFISNCFYNSFLIGKGDNVVAISSYLESLFSKRQCNICRIPPIFEVKRSDIPLKQKRDKLVFSYLGSPGKKDNISMCIQGFASFLSEEGSNHVPIEVRFYGFGSNVYENVLGQFPERVQRCFRFFGQVGREEVKKAYSETDFVFLMRDQNKRYSKAGFPSKVVEALCNNTPSITNRTSDLDSYLTDGKDVYFVDSYSSTEFRNKIAELAETFKFETGKTDCIKTAERLFSLDRYSRVFLNFVKKATTPYSEDHESIEI